MKKISLIMAMVLALTGVISGCSKNDQGIEFDPETEFNPEEIVFTPTEIVPEMIVGGISNDNLVCGTLPDGAKAACDEAFEGKDYIPVCCLGQQVVAGMNYAVLVSDSNGNYKVVKIYKPINGDKASITGEKDFDYNTYITNEIKVAEEPEMLEGGWNVPTEGGLYAMPERLATATAGAFLSFDEVTLDAMANLASQVVAGTNYYLICRGFESRNMDTTPALYFVVIYDAVDGSQQLTTVCPINILDVLPE